MFFIPCLEPGGIWAHKINVCRYRIHILSFSYNFLNLLSGMLYMHNVTLTKNGQKKRIGQLLEVVLTPPRVKH